MSVRRPAGAVPSIGSDKPGPPEREPVQGSLEASWGDRYVARLLGTGLRQPAYDRGRRFVLGVVERAGEEGLARLWTSAEVRPTPAEVDAPGLWLARIDLAGTG